MRAHPRLRAALRITWLSLCATLGGLAAVRTAQAARDPAGAYRKLDIFTHVLSLIHNTYVEPADESRLIYGAIDGMVRTLDPHSSFLDPQEYAALKQETDGEYGGVGLELAQKEDGIFVVTPLDRSPAARAGLQPGDKLTAVNGASTEGWKESDAVHALLGPPGSSVRLEVQRAGWTAPRRFDLLRDVVRVVSVANQLYGGRIGYARIRTFQDRTDADLKAGLAALRKKAGGRLDGLVLDLRHNPGGLLDEAVKVADRFLTSGVIVTVRGRPGQRVEVERAHAKDTEPAYPLIVLVDGGTASASEIVAGALQDSGRGVVLGTQTFGKGSVQSIIELEDGSGLKLTVARYYTPSGRSIQERGISPDLVVKGAPGALGEGTPDEELRESNLPNHFKGEGAAPALAPGAAHPAGPRQPGDPSDPQLQAALDTLRNWETFRAGRPPASGRAVSARH